MARTLGGRRRRRLSGWVQGGVVAIGLLAAMSLAATIFVAQRALGDASNVVVRGEGDALVTAVNDDLRAAGVSPTSALLAGVLEKHEGEGLRYVAIVEHGGRRLAEAGRRQLPEGPRRPGELVVVGGRVGRAAAASVPRFDGGENGGPPEGPTGPMPPPGRGPTSRESPQGAMQNGDVPGDLTPDESPSPIPPGGRSQISAEPGGGPGVALGGPSGGFGPRRPPHPPPLIVIEFEPPVILALRTDLRRATFVGAFAAAILVTFAVAWARSVVRLAAVEQTAEREKRLAALGRMASVMAHELRNPLASLKGHAQLLAESLEGDARAREKAERVVGDAERLERLTTSLLDFVRDGPIEIGVITPRELMNKALENLPLGRVRVELERAPETLALDEARVVRAAQNVVQNALLADPTGMVDVVVERQGEGVMIEVRDQGPGLPPASEGQIFEPFVTTRVRGTGLGLPVARRIAEQHGGTLTGENAPGGGAVFRMYLPKAARAR